MYAVIIKKKSSISKVDPCGVCDERVSCNSIQCKNYQRWIYYHVGMSLSVENVSIIVQQMSLKGLKIF